MQSAIINFLIYAGIAARIAALVRGARSRLLGAHPLFCAMLLLSLARAIVSATNDRSLYTWFFSAVQWPLAILEAGAVFEAFWRIAAHFRKIRGFGWILIGVIAGIAAIAAAAVGLLRANWNASLNGALLFGMYTHVGLLVAGLLSLAFFSQFRGVPIRPNAMRHLAVLCVLFGTYFCGNFIGQVTRGGSRFLPNLLIAAGTVIGYGWWAAAMSRAGEQLPFDPPPEMPGSTFDQAEARFRKAASDLKKASDQAWGNSER